MRYKKYFTMSFDDGPEQDKKLIKILNKYGLKCTFNLNSGLMGQKKWALRLGDIGFAAVKNRNSFPAFLFKGAECNIIPSDEVADVYKGFEVASHGYEHKMMKYLKEEGLNKEIFSDIEAINCLTGSEIFGHAYPFGLYSDAVINCLKKSGVKYARTAKSTHSFFFPDNPYIYNPTCACFDSRVFDLIDSFINAEALAEDLLFCLWGHSYEFDFGTKRNSWQKIEKIMEKISGYSDIIYCTNNEAFELHSP